MADRVIVNFDETYGKGVFLGVEPKMQPVNRDDRNGPKEQVRDNDGVLKWTASVAVKSLLFESAKKEVITITINSREQPYGAIPIGSFVVVDRLEMGVMKQDKSGFSTFFSAKNIRQVAAERVAPGQLLQPVRQASGQ